MRYFRFDADQDRPPGRPIHGPGRRDSSPLQRSPEMWGLSIRPAWRNHGGCPRYPAAANPKATTRFGTSITARSGSARVSRSTSTNGMVMRLLSGRRARRISERHRPDFQGGARGVPESVATALTDVDRGRFPMLARTAGFYFLEISNPDGRSRCFCGEVIDIAGVDRHIYAAHRIGSVTLAPPERRGFRPWFGGRHASSV
jgi:hypothetical protein